MKVGEQRTYRSHQERLMMEALDIIGGSRRASYGPPERNFHRAALLHSAYLSAKIGRSISLDAIDVCHMQDLVKLARLIETPDHEDSIRDRFGYQGCYVDLVLNKSSGEWQDWPLDTAPPADGGIGGKGFGGYDTAEEWEAVKARLSRNVSP
jgi:hypothetical protein